MRSVNPIQCVVEPCQLRLVNSPIIPSFPFRFYFIPTKFISFPSKVWNLYWTHNHMYLHQTKDGTISHYFDNNVQILSARFFKLSIIKKQNKNVNFFYHFQINAVHHVIVKNKSLVQAKIFFSKYVDISNKH